MGVSPGKNKGTFRSLDLIFRFLQNSVLRSLNSV